MNTAAISERVIGQYPLSIATSLAIEGAMGIHPDKPDQTKKLLPNYEVVWVNLKTIFRNLYNAIDRSVVQDVKPQDFVDAFTSEIDQLKSVIHVETASKTDVVLYVSDYAGMDQKYRHAILRGDQTPLQQQYSKLMVYTIAQYLKTHGHDVKRYTLKITDAEPRRALILTHYAFDLLAPRMPNLSLLESHTGTIKDKHQWYTKYLNGRELVHIPFREDMLQVFGDNEHFRPMKPSIRKQILELAEQYRWTQVTTTDKIRAGIDHLKDPLLKEILRKL